MALFLLKSQGIIGNFHHKSGKNSMKVEYEPCNKHTNCYGKERYTTTTINDNNKRKHINIFQGISIINNLVSLES